MPPKSRKISEPPPLDVSAMPEFARVIRGLAHVPKTEVDASIAKEKAGKKQQRRRQK